MTQETNTPLAEKTFYTSPKKKIHSIECRHYQADKAGWQKVSSILTAIDQGYQICRICCPTESEINAFRQQATSSLPESSIETSSSLTTNKIASDSKSASETEETQPKGKNLSTATDFPDASPDKIVTDNLEKEIADETNTHSTCEQKSSPSPEKQTQEVNQQQSEEITNKSQEKTNKHQNKQASPAKSEDKQHQTPQKSDSGQEKIKNKADSQSNSQSDKKQKQNNKKSQTPKQGKKTYKILAGNGCHQAIAEVQGILVPPTEDKDKFMLILADGIQLEVLFRNPRLKWIAHNKDWIIGAHWFRGYPKMKDNKLVGFQIIAWDGNMPTNKKGWELWEFTGVWTVQKNLTVQRSMMEKEVRQIAKETGFIKKFKYTFTNSGDWMKNKKLWVGYVYKLICRREGDALKIQKVIPFACPRIKPVPQKRKPPQGQFKPKKETNKASKKKIQNQSSGGNQ